MIFNKDNNGAEEIRLCTGNYYVSNDFSKLTADITLATSEIKKLIGSELYAAIEAAYKSANPVEKYSDLVVFVQIPIALNATFNLYRSNDISHEDDGRKIKLDSTNERRPWQWQLDRDDAIQLDKYYRSLDALICELDSVDPDLWKTSEQKLARKKLLLSTADKFDSVFPIDGSWRMYMLLLPFIKEAERELKPQFGEDWEKYLDASDLEDEDSEVLERLLPAIATLAMGKAVRRLPLGVIPSGVIRRIESTSETRDTSTAASVEEVREMGHWLCKDAHRMVNDAKRKRNGSVVETILPVNSTTNKGMRV